jgi:uncharacterized protein (DUF305 family)
MFRFVMAAALLLSPAPAIAQDHATHGAAAPDLPAVCLADLPASAAHGMAPMAAGPHPDLMAGMDAMNADMMAGATAADFDVAFVCSMIAHHRGAVSMAEAELAAGDETFPRELAAAIIASQEKEIADMLAWLEARP